MKVINFQQLYCFALIVVLNLGSASNATKLWAQEAPAPQKIASLRVLTKRAEIGANEWLRCGIPIAKSDKIFSVDALWLGDYRRGRLNAHFRITSRWGGPPTESSKPAKWLEITATLPKGTNSAQLLGLWRDDRAQPPSMPLMCHQDGDTITVRFAGHDLLIQSGSLQLIKGLKHGASWLDQKHTGEVLAIDGKGKAQQPSPWQVAIEINSQHAAKIHATAKLGDLELSWRLHFARRASEFVADFRVLNPLAYGHMGTKSNPRYFQRLGLSLPAIKAKDIILEGESLAGAASVALVQAQQLTSKNEQYPFQIWRQEKLLRSGKRAAGLMLLANETASLGYGLESFWQNAPKAISYQDGRVVLDIFPFGGVGPVYRGVYGTRDQGPIDKQSQTSYRFEGARAKTHRFHLKLAHFAAAEETSPLAPPFKAEYQALDSAIRNPTTLIRCDAQTLLAAACGYPFAPANTQAKAIAGHNRWLQLLVDDSLAENQDALGRIGYPAFVARGGTYGGQIFHGWFNFGDVPWGDGYSNLHYDLPFTALLNTYRFEDPRFFELARDMSRHRRDIDQDHDSKSSMSQRGGQFYEKGQWHGNYYHPSLSHTWMRGPLLHYFMTGDEGSREAARLNHDFILRKNVDRWDGKWGARIIGWSLDNLVANWQSFGDARDLKLAAATIRNFQKLEQSYGGRGFVLNPEMKQRACQPWMLNIVFNGIAQYRLASGSKEFDPLMQRMLRFFRETALVMATGNEPHRAYRYFAPGIQKDPDHHLTWPMAASFALAYQCFQRPIDRDLARRLFSRVVDCVQSRPNSIVAFRMLNYPNAESKIHSNIALWGLLASSVYAAQPK